jgi:tRNA(Ile)-lysidine synthase
MTVSASSPRKVGMTSDVFSSFSYFETNPTLAVAVSGGADSMALLLLAHEWAKKHRGKVVALTVDHRLRKESAAEAAQVKTWCAEEKIEHHTLLWKPTSATQSAARDARYALLTSWCKKHHVLHLLTGHHQGDQAETFFFRLARGSGIDGLAGMAAESVRDGVRLLRPLLSLPKSSLIDFLREQKQPWIEDPTNNTAKYTRNIVRANLTPALNEKSAELAFRIGKLRYHLEECLAETMARTISIFSEGYAVLSMTMFKTLPPDYGVRTLSALVQTIGEEATPPRTEKLARLYGELLEGKTRTLGGCLFRYQPSKQRYVVKNEQKTPISQGFRPAKPLAGQPFLGLNGV